MTPFPPVRFLERRTPPHIATLILLAGIAALSQSIFLPSLAGMTEWFDTDYAIMQFSVSGYLATTAVVQLFVGALSDRFGRRSVMLWSLVIFVIATIAAILAPNVETFLIARMLQSAVATGLVLSRAIVRDMVPGPEAAARIGYVTMGMAIVPMLGPSVGGVLDAAMGWQGGFYFLLFGGLFVFALAFFDQGETAQPRAEGGAAPRGGVGELLRSPRFIGYTACTLFASGAFYALLGGASFVAAQVFSLSPFWTGVALGAPSIGYALGNFLAARFSTRIGIDRMVLIGTLTATLPFVAAIALTLAGTSNAWIFFGFCTFLGIGNGMNMPNATAGLLSVRPHLAGTASGLSGGMMIGGGALLAALAGMVLTPANAALTLQAIMLASLLMGLLSILLVMRRNRRLRGAP